MVFAGKEESCDNKSTDHKLDDFVDNGDEIEDSYADMPSFVHHSDNRTSDLSLDSDYEPESDTNDSDEDAECVFSSSDSEEILDDEGGYELLCVDTVPGTRGPV